MRAHWKSTFGRRGLPKSQQNKQGVEGNTIQTFVQKNKL